MNDTIFFTTFVNDTCYNSVSCLSRLCAEDTCLLINRPNLASLKTEMNKDYANIYKWCITNILSPNPSKSNHLIFPHKKSIWSAYFTLFINNLPKLSCDKAKYLGVFIDSHLNFNSLVKSVENKVAKFVDILSKLKHFLSSTSFLKLYYFFIHPHLLYIGLSVWGPSLKFCQNYNTSK